MLELYDAYISHRVKLRVAGECKYANSRMYCNSACGFYANINMYEYKHKANYVISVFQQWNALFVICSNDFCTLFVVIQSTLPFLCTTTKKTRSDIYRKQQCRSLNVQCV